MKSKPTILISMIGQDHHFQRVRDACPDAEVRIGPWVNDEGQTLSPELTRGADFLLCELPPANFDDLDSIKWIQLTSAGYSQVLDLPILQRGIRVTNGLGNFDSPIAQWNIMMMLMWHRNMLEQLQNQKDHRWDPAARFQSDVFGATVGFWGYGGIARETARLCKAMHLNVWAMTRDGKTRPRGLTYCVPGTGDPEGTLPDRLFSPAQVREFLGGLDYLFITTPQTPATTGMIDENELRMLKPSAVLINPARAPIVPLEALTRCLKEKWIRGASFDVHYAYPLPPDHPVWDLPNLILTPHISGSVESPHFLDRIYDIFSQNVRRITAGEPLLNELTPAQLQGK